MIDPYRGKQRARIAVLIEEWRPFRWREVEVRLEGFVRGEGKWTAPLLDVFGRSMTLDVAEAALEEGLVVRTTSGSLYRLGVRGEGDPPHGMPVHYARGQHTIGPQMGTGEQ